MEKQKIIQDGDLVLRQKTKNISLKDIGSKKIKDIIDKMSDALHASENGVGIAAPQIGISLPIFLVSEEVVSHEKSSEASTDKKGKEFKRKWKHFVFINPKLLKKSQKKEVLAEGCLSVEGVFGRVKRAKQVTVEAYNEEGAKIRTGASGLFAQVLQHELDHLEGVLFIDKAEYLENLDESTLNKPQI